MPPTFAFYRTKVTLLELGVQFINFLLIIDNITIQYYEFSHC